MMTWEALAVANVVFAKERKQGHREAINTSTPLCVVSDTLKMIKILHNDTIKTSLQTI